MFEFPDTLMAETVRWFCQFTNWRPNDETICWLGHKLPQFHSVSMRMRDGRWMWLDLRNPVSIPYLLDADFPCEQVETELVRHIVQPGDVTVDVGANLGWYSSLLAREVKSSGRVYAFEPNQKAARLVKNIARKHPQLEVRTEALSDQNDWSTFYITDNWISGSLHAEHQEAEEQRTKMVTLDTFLADSNHNTIDFLKLDAEGAEPQVLDGAARTLDRPDAPIWLLEMSSDEADKAGHHPADILSCFADASNANYRAFAISQEEHSLEPLTVPDRGDFWFNALIVPESRLGRLPESWLEGCDPDECVR